MGADSKIEWTRHTMNPWRGCTKVAAGCTNCYADTLSKRNPGTLGVWGPNGTRVVAAEATWREPLKWDRLAKAAGERHRVFCASLADVFEDWQGAMLDHSGQKLFVGDSGAFGTSPINRRSLTMADVRRRLFALIDATPNLDWLLLTKRPENIRRMWVPYGPNAADGEMDEYRLNVWLLTSVAEQKDADANIPELLKCRDLCPVLGVSAEPLVGPVDFERIRLANGELYNCLSGKLWHLGDWVETDEPTIDWVIVGGESGHGARGFDIGWAYSIMRQCRAAGVPCFMKQLGADPYRMDCYGDLDVPGGLHHFADPISLKDKKGGDWNEWPAELRVREFPKGVAQ